MNDHLKKDPAEYANAAALAKEVADDLLTRLELVTLKPRAILHMHCKTGELSEQLAHRYPDATLYALDPSDAMLDYAKKTVSATIEWMSGDNQLLSFEENSIDLIVANLFILTDIENTFQEWRRVLRPNGLLMLTTLGPDTLAELQNPVGLLPHFLDMHLIGDALVRAGFQDPVLDVEHFCLHYRTKEQLLRELYLNELIFDPSLAWNVKKNEQDPTYSITHEVIYAHTWSPENHIASEDGIVKIPFNQLRAQLLGR